MADGSIATNSFAGSKVPARTGSSTPRSRTDALGGFSAPNSYANQSNELSFPKAVATSGNLEAAPQQAQVAEPGNGMLSTSSQLLLAETRTQETLSLVADKSTLDQALNRYTQSQTSVIETMGLSLLTGGTAAVATGETSA